VSNYIYFESKYIEVLENQKKNGKTIFQLRHNIEKKLHWEIVWNYTGGRSRAIYWLSLKFYRTECVSIFMSQIVNTGKTKFGYLRIQTSWNINKSKY